MTQTTAIPDATAGPKVNVALVQIRVAPPDDVQGQCAHMRELVLKAVKEGKDKGNPVNIAVLPEMWNTPTTHEQLVKLAEPLPQPGAAASSWPDGAYTARQLSAVAKEANIWIVGGSIPEVDDEGRRYNCATVWSPEGSLVQKYRKTHLFDLCLPKMTYKESDTFSPGQSLAMFDTPYGRFGLAICYDLRFAEIATLAARQGCVGVFYPAAFNTHTGPLHWQILQQARALDNQIYIATCSCARDETAKYVIYGHSMAVSPMGAVVATAEEKETIVHATFDPQVIADTRAGIPLLAQRRFDLYPDIAAVVANGTA